MSESGGFQESKTPLLRSVLLTVVVLFLAWTGWTVWRDHEATNVQQFAPSPVTERIQAIERLTEKGEAAVPELVALLKSPDVRTREMAGVALNRIGPAARAAIPALLERLGDERDSVRLVALRALRNIGHPLDDQIPTLAGLLRSGDPTLRSEAAAVLVGLGPQVIPTVIATMDAERADSRRDVLQVLGQVGNEDSSAEAVIRRGLTDADGTVRALAFRILISWKRLTLDEVVAGLRDKDNAVVMTAANGVLILEGDVDPAVHQLVELLERVEVWHPTVRVLSTLGTRAKAGVPGVIRVLESKPAGYAETLLPALGRMAAGDETAARHVVPFLVERSSYGSISENAGVALRRISPAAVRAAVPAVVEALRSDDHQRRSRAAAALAGLGPDASSTVPALRDALKDSDEWVRYYSAVALGEIGEASEPAVPELAALASRPTGDRGRDRSGGQMARNEALHSLVRIAPSRPETLECVFKVLSDPDPQMRHSALTGLSAIECPQDRAGQALAAALQDDSQAVRVRAATCVAQLEIEASTAVPLLEVALRDSSLEVRTAAAAAVAHYGPEAKETATLLLALREDLPDPSPRVSEELFPFPDLDIEEPELPPEYRRFSRGYGRSLNRSSKDIADDALKAVLAELGDSPENE